MLVEKAGPPTRQTGHERKTLMSAERESANDVILPESGSDRLGKSFEPSANGRPRVVPVERLPIEVTSEVHTVNERAVKALTKDMSLYHRGGALVHVIRTEKDEIDTSKVKRAAGTPHISAPYLLHCCASVSANMDASGRVARRTSSSMYYLQSGV
jgi:hypothetical protein